MAEYLAGLDVSPGAFTAFHAAGDRVSGVFRCAECGYGVAVQDALPLCPMCRGHVWEATEARRAAPSEPAPA